MFRAIIDARNTALHHEERERILERIDALEVVAVKQVAADIMVVEEVDEKVTRADALTIRALDTVDTGRRAEQRMAAARLPGIIPAVELRRAVLPAATLTIKRLVARRAFDRVVDRIFL